MGRSPDDIRAAIDGPINSMPTTFLADGGLDWQGIGRIVDVGIDGGSGVSLLTVGDSQLELLTDDEVEELTRFLVERVAGRALTVAAAKRGPTARTVEFARFCRDVGVDALMVLPSQFATPAGTVELYIEVAAVMPVMLVGMPDHALLDQIVDEPNICCFKEDGTLDYAVTTQAKYGHRWAFLTGGGLWRNYTQWPWCRAFFCFFSCFAPHVARAYADAARSADVESAGRIIREVEFPFRDLVELVGGNFHALWRAAIELNGVAARGLRPPMTSATDAQLEALQPRLEALGLLTNP